MIAIHKIRVYADTSVFGGVLDKEFSEASKRFFRQVAEGDYVVLLSGETLRELAGAPEAVREIWRNLDPEVIEEIEISVEVEQLARAYIEAGVLQMALLSDALHVAAATVFGADLILSWNFKHMVNFNRIRGFNGVNVRMGYRSMSIMSPLEIGDDEE